MTPKMMEKANIVGQITLLAIGAFSCSQTTSPQMLESDQGALPEVSLVWRGEGERLTNQISDLQLDISSQRLGEVGAIKVMVRNTGDKALRYFGYGRSTLRIFQEVWEKDSWVKGEWDWCGTGLEEAELAPGEEVVFRTFFYDSQARQRILTEFEEVESGERSMVVLVTQLPYEKD